MSLEDGSFMREELSPSLKIGDFQLKGNDSYCYVVPEGSSEGEICTIKITEKGYAESPKAIDASPITSAFYIKDEYIYYYGCKSFTKDGVAEAKGIYRIAVDGNDSEGQSAPKLILDMTKTKYDVSYMYVSEGRLYCYYSNGEKTSANPYYMLEMYELNDDGTVKNNAAKQIFCKN
jgi:hypothetical protein